MTQGRVERAFRIAEEIEPQAPAPLGKCEIATIGPVGAGRGIGQDAGSLNRTEKEAAERGQRHQLLHVGALLVLAHEGISC